MGSIVIGRAFFGLKKSGLVQALRSFIVSTFKPPINQIIRKNWSQLIREVSASKLSTEHPRVRLVRRGEDLKATRLNPASVI